MKGKIHEVKRLCVRENTLVLLYRSETFHIRYFESKNPFLDIFSIIPISYISYMRLGNRKIINKKQNKPCRVLLCFVLCAFIE